MTIEKTLTDIEKEQIKEEFIEEMKEELIEEIEAQLKTILYQEKDTTKQKVKRLKK